MVDPKNDPRDDRPVVNIWQIGSEPKPLPLVKSYYHSPADEDFLYKFQAIFRKVTGLIVFVGVYDGYVMHQYKQLVPILCRMSVHVLPGYTAAGIFIAANAVAVKLNGKDTPWCHFAGGLASFAYVSHHYGLKMTYPLGLLFGFIAVRYRYARGREIETGIPMFAIGDRSMKPGAYPSIISQLVRFKPLYKMPPEHPQL